MLLFLSGQDTIIGDRSSSEAGCCSVVGRTLSTVYLDTYVFYSTYRHVLPSSSASLARVNSA